MKSCQIFLLQCPKTIQNPFRSIAAIPGRFSILYFIPLRKKRFLGGILFTSKSPQLRAMKFNTILGLFLIYNGKLDLKVVIPSTVCRDKKLFFRPPPMMSFGFLDVIFREKGLEVDTYKSPNLFGHITHIWSTRVDQSGPELQN